MAPKTYYNVVSIAFIRLGGKVRSGKEMRLKGEKNMKKWVLLVLLGAFLATAMGGCKKGG